MVSVCASALGLCVLVPISRPVGLLDYPDARKRHAFATPLVGGLSIFVGVLAGWLWLGRSEKFDDIVLATSCVLVALGALDDRYGLRVSVRVLVQVAAILIVISTTGMYVHSLGILHGYDLQLGWLGIPFTVVAVIGLINAFNLMDGIDGLAGCLALVSTGAIALLMAPNMPAPLTIIVLLLAAALYPFLMANLGLLGRKAKVFLGDSGSVVLGYIIAWTLIALSQSTPRLISPGLVQFGAIANAIAFVVVAVAYGAFTTHLERKQAARAKNAPRPKAIARPRAVPSSAGSRARAQRSTINM